jgi:hypothetical protein
VWHAPHPVQATAGVATDAMTSSLIRRRRMSAEQATHAAQPALVAMTSPLSADGG